MQRLYASAELTPAAGLIVHRRIKTSQRPLILDSGPLNNPESGLKHDEH